MTDNVLRALGALDDEDVISNLLAYCVNSSRSFAAHFMSAVQGCGPDSYDEICAYERKRVLGTGTPDLVLKASSGEHCDLVIIENKVTAEEGKGQTKRYSRPSCVERLRARLSNEHPSGEWRGDHYAFLTLYPWQKPRNPHFRHVTYQRLLSATMPYERGQDTLADRLFGHLSDAYSAFYASGRIDRGDLLMQKWSAHGDLRGLDRAFLHFGNVFASMRYPLGLEVGLIARASRTGRLYYLAQVSKDSWRLPAPSAKPGFHIHFEPQFSVLSCRFSLYLHHEIRDYRPRAQAVKDFGTELAEYDAAREQFIRYLTKTRVSDLVLGGGSNQVAKVRVKFDERTSLGEFPDAVCSAIARVAKAIDEFLLGQLEACRLQSVLVGASTGGAGPPLSPSD